MANRTILVTGASSDIGIALIRHLLGKQDPPKILAHSHTGGPRILALKEEFDEAIQPFTADFTVTASVAQMAEEIMASHGVPDAVVHLPALRLTYERFSKFDWSRFQTDMEVQIHSAVTLLQKMLPKMSKIPNSRVVFVLSSVTLGMPPKFMSAYTMLKYTQLGLMRSLATEYAATSVRINGISPSMVETQFLQDIAEVAVQMSASSNPKGRNAAPADLLGAIEFLLSPAVEYISGVDIPITAGMTR